MGTARAPLASLNASLNTPDALSSTDKAPITSAKRQHSAIEDADDDDEENDAPQLRYVTDSCDQVRRKINTFINSGEMKVGEFQKAIGVNSRSYGTFMTQRGPTKGMGSSVYYNAFKFFKKREIKGILMPKKKVKNPRKTRS